MPTRWVRNQATETSACTRAHVDPQAKSHRSDDIIPGQRVVKRERRCKPPEFRSSSCGASVSPAHIISRCTDLPRANGSFIEEFAQ